MTVGTRYALEDTRAAAATLLVEFGDHVQFTHVRSTNGDDGSVVLDAYLVPLL